MRDRLTVLEEQERNHSSKNEEILKRLQVQEAGSRLQEKTSPMIVKMKQLSNRMMRMESKMQSMHPPQRTMTRKRSNACWMWRILFKVDASRCEASSIVEQRRTEDNEMLQSLVKENT